MNLYVYNLPVTLVILLFMPFAVVCLFRFNCLPMKLLHKLLQKLDIVERGPEDCDEKPQSTLHGHEVPLFSVKMFTFNLFSTFFLIGTAFINTLLVQRTMSCNPKLDCFLVNSIANYDLSLYTTPVNCNNLTDESVFVCYKFQFDLTNALASAGGLITIAKLTINTTTSVLSWLMNRQTRKGQKIVTFTIISSLVICYFLFIMCTMFIPELNVIFTTYGFITMLQLLLFIFSVGTATVAVASVYHSVTVKK